MFEEQIVHRSKLILGISYLACFSCLLSQGMFMNQREMAKHEPQSISKSSPEPFNNRIRTPAVRAGKIAVGHRRNNGGIGACTMVIVSYAQHRFHICRGLVDRHSLLGLSAMFPICVSHQSRVLRRHKKVYWVSIDSDFSFRRSVVGVERIDSA